MSMNMYSLKDKRKLFFLDCTFFEINLFSDHKDKKTINRTKSFRLLTIRKKKQKLFKCDET